jgi:copper transport protein
VVLVINEHVTLAPTPLSIIDFAGAPVSVDQVATATRGTTVTGRVHRSLAPGVYTVRWRLTGADGDLVESTFRFAVGIRSHRTVHIGRTRVEDIVAARRVAVAAVRRVSPSPWAVQWGAGSPMARRLRSSLPPVPAGTGSGPGRDWWRRPA